MSQRLTEKQRAVLDFIAECVEEGREWPSYDDFKREFGYKSSNSVTQNLKALAKKGYLIKTQAGYQLPPENRRESESAIPVLGEITAGVLQEAVGANLGNITLGTIFPSLDRIFALRVRGQSMIGADIHDGDYVLLVDDDIPNGGIGAVLYDGETSLKRVYMDYGGLRLEPANPEFDDIRIDPDIFEEVKILGRYIGHVNKQGLYRTPSTHQISTTDYSPFKRDLWPSA